MGEGSGGGGALVALLALWVVTAAFVMTAGGFMTPDGGPAGVVVRVPDPPGVATALGASFGVDCESAGTCDTPVLRGELAATLASAFALPAAAEDFFGDDDGTDFEDANNRLAAAAITGGCAEAAYCPDIAVQRGPLATMLARVLDLPGSGENLFDDDDGTAHEPAINSIAAAGIIDGCGPRAFCPTGTVTHRQLVGILERATTVLQPAS